MEITTEILEDLIAAEDSIIAYNGGYYDTHDLESIEQYLEEYEDLIQCYKDFLPNGVELFCCCILESGKLIKEP